MKIELDTHTHTIASGHAYSSLNEMAAAASEKGLTHLAITDHGPAMPGGAHLYHFHNLKIVPNYLNGVRILKGIEANIVNYGGELDVSFETLSLLDIVIASFHPPCLGASNVNRTTDGLIKVIENPYIDIIGHPDDSRYRFDVKNVVEAAKEHKVLLEVNNSSLLPTSFRENCREGYIKLLEVCAAESLPIVMGSDAHHTSAVGQFDMALGLLKEIGFPEELIMNRSAVELFKYRGKRFD